MSDVEQDLRDRLRAAPPAFDPVSMAAVAVRVEDHHRATRAAGRVALLTAAVLLSGIAILVPALTLGHGGGSSNSAGGAAAYSGGRPDTGNGVEAPAAGSTNAASPAKGATPSPAGGRAGCPPRMSGQGIVDYVDFVRIGGREYLAGSKGVAQTVPPGKLGRKLGTVRCTLSVIGPDPYYHPVDGDAGYLPAGTPLYEVSSPGPNLRIAAPVGGKYRVYESYPPR